MATSKDYSRSIIAASDEVQDIFCEPCEQDGRKTEAEGFCVDCPEYLCGQCYKNHKLYKAFRNHVLQDRDKMPQTVTGVSVKDVCIQKCSKHPDEIIKYFCWSCDSLGCSTCMILDHRQCKKVDDIPKLVTLQETQDEFLTFIKKMDTISEQIQRTKNQIKSFSDKTDDLRKVAKAELERQHAEINKFFEDLKKELDKKIDDIHDSNKESLTEVSRKYDSMHNDLMHIKNDFDVKNKTGQNCEALIAMKCCASDLKILESKLETLHLIQKYKLIPSTEVQEMKSKINEICKIETETEVLGARVHQNTDKQQKQMPTSSSEIQDTSKTSENTNLKSLRLGTVITAKTLKESGKLSPRGLLVMHEHFVVVADRQNKALTVIDTRNKKVTSEMNMKEDVWNVTNVTDAKIAVALKSAVHFLYVSKAGLLSTDYVVNTAVSFDLVYSKEKLFLAQSNRVQIINMQGRVLDTFRTDSDGKKLFVECYGMAISPDSETIYISDYTQNTLTSMTLDGEVKAIYTDNDLKRPWGVTVDNEGYVYVSSLVTKSIHQLSADCTKLQIIYDVAADSITCTNTNKLIAGADQRIWIYDLI